MNAFLLEKIPLDDAYTNARKFPLVQFALEIIRKNVSSSFCYHSEHHTLDVIRESLRFGKAAKLGEEDLYLLTIAAAWHDVGFMFQRDDHEELSVEQLKRIAGESSEPLLTDEQLETVSQLIRDTKLYKTDDGVVQIPTLELSRYLLDADLSNLGREDFFDCLDLLCMEHGAEAYEFYRRTLGFITRHTWHTDTAREMRLKQEIKNTAELARRIMDERYLLAD